MKIASAYSVKGLTFEGIYFFLLWCILQFKAWNDAINVYSLDHSLTIIFHFKMHSALTLKFYHAYDQHSDI